MQSLKNLVAILLALALYYKIMDMNFINEISNKNFYVIYISILYASFIANSLLYYGFFKYIAEFRYQNILYNIILSFIFIIIPISISIYCGTKYNIYLQGLAH